MKIRNQRGFTLFQAMLSFLVLAILLTVLWYGIIATLIYTAANSVDDHGGLKGVTERMWYGKEGPPKQ